MNKKIFTLLVGAGLLVGSSITVNAQRQKPYSDKNSWSVRHQQTNFNDILTADTVKKLAPAPSPSLPFPSYKDYYYLLSVTDLANPNGTVATQFATKLGNYPASIDQSYVMFVDEMSSTPGSEVMNLRIENLADLDSIYNYNYENPNNASRYSSKFGAIRRASWCLDYQQLDVFGSNIVFDFTNMETGRTLEAPIIYDDVNHTKWSLDGFGNKVYNGPINTYDPDLIVNGWHFSQTYISTQNLQTGMPLYSYVTTDTVAVLVLEEDAYVDPKAGNDKIGGYTVTVKHVAVNDLIRDAAGNVRLVGSTTDPNQPIRNVLLFTLKKVNKFVLNADDWNVINTQISFNQNATIETTNKDKKNIYTNPFTDNPLFAEEANDSLYHYGYMQFKAETGTYQGSYLYVDTAWANQGNDQYLAFAWSERRDSTQQGLGISLNRMLWGDSYTTSYAISPMARSRKPDSVYYFDYAANIATPPLFAPYGQVYWRLDSLVWAVANYLVNNTNSMSWSAPLIDATGNLDLTATYSGGTITPALNDVLGKSTFAEARDLWEEIVANALLFGTPTSLSATAPVSLTLNNGGTETFIDFIGVTVVLGDDYVQPRAAGYDWSAEYALDALYHIDSVNFIYAFMKDSIMENQSKFRVVYDPFADSTFINVYQTRVRHPNYAGTPQNATWPYWWENSFAVADNGFPVGPFRFTRPSDAHTNTMYNGIPFIDPTVTTVTTPIAQAAWNYYTNQVLPLTTFGNNGLNRYSDETIGTPPYDYEGHGKSHNEFNFHSFMYFYPQSKYPYMDKVMISTADTCPIFNEYYSPAAPAEASVSALSHMYRWSLTGYGTTGGGEPKYRDSLFYVDLQNLESASKTIVTLDQSYKNGKLNLDTHIKISYGPKCIEGEDNAKATIPNGLYLIRNSLGQYLSVPLSSVTDSVYWSNPESNEDLTKIPSYQWAIMNTRNVAHSPFRMVNREFERVNFPYVYVYENQTAPFQIAGIYSGAKFNNKNVHAGVTADSIGTNKVIPAATFLATLAEMYSKDEISFIRLDQGVKQNQFLGYKYIDKDSTIVDVYAFKYLHHSTRGEDGVPRYMSWNGYKEGSTDTALYVQAIDYYDKLYFNLQEMTDKEIRPLDSYGQGKVALTAQNTKAGKENALFAGVYNNLANKDRQYTNADSIVLERFGFYENNTGIPYLTPLVRQAYRLFLQDYYRWHPTVSGHYLTVGEQDRYVLADKANAIKKYVKGSGSTAGLFGIPHFYFRETYFDVDTKSNDYFALVQRLDTARVDDQNYYQWGAPSYGDVLDYYTLLLGSPTAIRLLGMIKDSNELGFGILEVQDESAEALFTLRADHTPASNASTFQLERDDDPIYRRFHVNEPAGNFGDELNGTDIPDTLEFHHINKDKDGWRLYENSGNYTDAEQSNLQGADGGRVYNRYNDGAGDYYRDTLIQSDGLGNVISYLGMNNSYQYGPNYKTPGTNYSIFVDTAYINRGTGWIKPQYMLVVDPYNPYEKGDCDPNTGDKDSPNGNYVIGRYLYNSAMYAKAGKDSVLNADYDWEFSNKLYDIPTTGSATVKGYLYRTDNFSKVEPIKETVIRKPNGSVYTYDVKWERPAFTWAIHKGDSLYVLKGVEPAYKKNPVNDPKALWQQLCKEYGGTGTGDYIDFDKLISWNTVETYKEVYYPLGDRGQGELRTFRTFKPYAQVLKDGKTIGLQAVIALDDNTHKDWVFSFRYIERGASDFVIESETTDRDTRNGAMIRPGYGGWIKNQNGVLVITRSDAQEVMGQAGGAVFNVQRRNNPVSNEGVTTPETSDVKVVAGTGTVSILNATGKNVVISNMLGQTIANTKVSSDNASIAVPAGVVVVVVEGESAVKTLVK
ncbi:MAG: DUF6383 domain-containing protein [Tannerella sp.]|nr:DUF6383 domain-containing protein [Tannerella sp.]